MGIIGIALAFYVYQYVINKPHPDYENLEPEYTLLASDLFEKYRNDRSKAEERYNGKMIQLHGTFDHIEQNGSLMVGVFVFDEGMFGEEGVRCTMLGNQEHALGERLLGQEVRVKGFVTGYNETDVILEKCSFIQ